jgi:transposase
MMMDWLKEATTTAAARRLGPTCTVDGIMQRAAVVQGLARRKPVTDLLTFNVLHVAGQRRKSSLDGVYEQQSLERLATLGLVAMDKVHGEEHRAPPSVGDRRLTGTIHLLPRRGNALAAHDERVVDLKRRVGLKASRARAIKEAASRLWSCLKPERAEKAVRKWISWTMRSRIEPTKKAAQAVRAHLWGTVSRQRYQRVDQHEDPVVKKTPRGFRNRDRFRNAMLFHLGGFDIYPASATHTDS